MLAIGNNNLYEIFQLLLQKYQDDVERKEWLQNKAMGYLIALAIILTASIAIIIFSIKEIEYGSLLYVLLILAFFVQFYFSVWAFVFSLRAYEKRKTYFPSVEDFAASWDSPKNEFLCGINKTLKDCIQSHEKMLDALLFNIDMCRLFLYIAFTAFVVFCMVFFMFLSGA